MNNCGSAFLGFADRLARKIKKIIRGLEKPRDFDPFGHAGFAHLWLQYD